MTNWQGKMGVIMIESPVPNLAWISIRRNQFGNANRLNLQVSQLQSKKGVLPAGSQIKIFPMCM